MSAARGIALPDDFRDDIEQARFALVKLRDRFTGRDGGGEIEAVCDAFDEFMGATGADSSPAGIGEAMSGTLEAACQDVLLDLRVDRARTARSIAGEGAHLGLTMRHLRRLRDGLLAVECDGEWVLTHPAGSLARELVAATVRDVSERRVHVVPVPSFGVKGGEGA